MHPLRSIRSAVRTVLAVLAGLAAALAIAGPATAAPSGFTAWDEGEDGCTVFETVGEADWNVMGIPEQPHVRLTGKAYVFAEPQICLPVVPRDRHVRFLGYDRGGEQVAELAVPFGSGEGVEYDTSLVPAYGTSIAYLTVAVCVTDAVTWDGRPDCGETRVVRPAL